MVLSYLNLKRTKSKGFLFCFVFKGPTSLSFSVWQLKSKSSFTFSCECLWNSYCSFFKVWDLKRKHSSYSTSFLLIPQTCWTWKLSFCLVEGLTWHWMPFLKNKTIFLITLILKNLISIFGITNIPQSLIFSSSGCHSTVSLLVFNGSGRPSRSEN